MALGTDQILREVQALLDIQIRMTMSGAASCLTDTQWREYNNREARIAALLNELDTVNSTATERKLPYPEMNLFRNLTGQAS